MSPANCLVLLCLFSSTAFCQNFAFGRPRAYSRTGIPFKLCQRLNHTASLMCFRACLPLTSKPVQTLCVVRTLDQYFRLWRCKLGRQKGKQREQEKPPSCCTLLATCPPTLVLGLGGKLIVPYDVTSTYPNTYA